MLASRYRTQKQFQFIFGLWLRALGLATINHAYLGDYDQVGWFVPRVCAYVFGAVLLFIPKPTSNPYARKQLDLWQYACWILCASKIYTLLFLRDVLTQSLLLTFFYLISAISLRHPKYIFGSLRAIVLLTSTTYLLAILHKLNYDFLSSPQSCAIHGFDLSLSLVLTGDLLELKEGILSFLTRWPLIPSLTVIAIELSLSLLCLRHSTWTWYLGLVFHLPLTLTIAPSFGNVMAVGWGAGSLIATFEGSIKPNRYRLSALYMWLIFTYAVHGAMSPYLGIEVQHSSAMLSNLRIDPPCHNSLIFPQLSDSPYVYIDKVQFGQNPRPKRSKVLKEGLWSLTALATMQKNWCIPENRPLSLSLRYYNQTYSLKDLCEPKALIPLYDKSLNLRFLSWQRFQKNLRRQCHQSCVH